MVESRVAPDLERTAYSVIIDHTFEISRKYGIVDAGF